jgi:error-prone DNA polymerase
VVLPDVWARHREVVRKSPALVIEGRLEFHDGVTNIVARSFEPIGVQTVQSRDFR